MIIFPGDMFIVRRWCCFWERTLEEGEVIMFLFDEAKKKWMHVVPQYHFLTSLMIVTANHKVFDERLTVVKGFIEKVI